MLNQNFLSKRDFKSKFPLVFKKRNNLNQKHFNKRIKFDFKLCSENSLQQKSQIEQEKEKAFESEAGEFLKNYGVINSNLQTPISYFEQAYINCPEVFKLNTYEIGTAILNFKQAGISDDDIFSFIFAEVPQAFFSQNRSYFINIYDLFNSFFEDYKCTVQIVTDLFDAPDMKYFQFKISKIEKNLKIISKYVKQLNNKLFLVGFKYNPNFNINYYDKQQKAFFCNTKKLEIHLNNLSKLCDKCKKYYDQKQKFKHQKKQKKDRYYFSNNFLDIKDNFLAESLLHLNYMILNNEDFQDALKKLEYIHSIGCNFYDVVDFFNFFYYDLELCIKPRYEFVLKNSKLRSFKTSYNKECYWEEQFFLKNLLDCSDSEFCQKMKTSVESFNEFKKQQQRL